MGLADDAGPEVDRALEAVDAWGADHAAAVVIGPDGHVASRGDLSRTFRWASVTKPVTALTVLVAADRGLLDLDEAAGPPGSTVRHLLAHTSGLPFEGTTTLAAPGSRRIYSNPGFDELGRLVSERAGMAFGDALASFVLGPLGASGTRLLERPSQGLHGPLADLALAVLTDRDFGPWALDAWPPLSDAVLAAATSGAPR
jgi:CubicO group peptidase (beta-lactamase class C family)